MLITDRRHHHSLRRGNPEEPDHHHRNNNSSSRRPKVFEEMVEFRVRRLVMGRRLVVPEADQWRLHPGVVVEYPDHPSRPAERHRPRTVVLGEDFLPATAVRSLVRHLHPAAVEEDLLRLP